MTEQEVQETVGNLGQIVAQHAIDLAVARATIARLERELNEARSGVSE